MKLSCIIDTCSCIYLEKALYRQKSLLWYLFKHAKLSYSHEVGLEIQDHRDKGIPGFMNDKALKLIPQMIRMEEYELKMFGCTLPSRVPKGDKGEVNNLIIALDQVHHLKRNNSIFITDDKKAINGFLEPWLKAYPVLKLWTSYEVLLFLYAEKVVPSIDIANNLLQELIAAKAPLQGNRSPKTAQELIKIKEDYSKRLQTISKLLN